MKICSTCKENKHFEDFSKYARSDDGLQPRCKQCTNDNNARTNPHFNKLSMYVNGKYVSKKHPLYKPGRYRTLGDAWSNIEIDQRSSEGSVYIIHNRTWFNWYKVGKAASAEDRLNGYQTSSPFRDYELLYSVEFADRHKAETDVHKLLRSELTEDNCRGEWFKADIDFIKDAIDNVKALENQLDLFDRTG